MFQWQWHPPADGWDKPRFRDLTHLVRSLVRRFEADAYSMHLDEEGYLDLDVDDEILARLRGIEIEEAGVRWGRCAP